ncbi:MAG: S8 family serine peptidase [Verrucomicrobiaceae bacterium]
MKSTRLSLISLLLLSGAAFGQVAPKFGAAPAAQMFQFTNSGQPYSLQLCTTEVCSKGPSGALQIEAVEGGVKKVMALADQDAGANFLVFYPAGEEGNQDKAKVLKNRFLIKLRPGADIDAVKKRCGISKIDLRFPDHGLAICEESSASKVLNMLDAVAADPSVEYAEPIFGRKLFKRLVPTDPFYSPPGDYQWNLKNTGANNGLAGVDINIEAAWEVMNAGNTAGVDGTGIPVVVVDDGVFHPHPDLVNNYNINDDVNLVEGNEDADPMNAVDTHGTEVAGIIGAERNNDVGISGVAPNADLVGIRLLGDGFPDDADIADALGHNGVKNFVSNNSWGFSDFETTMEPASPLAKAAIETAAQGNRALQSGTVFVWAGGNGAENSDNSNYDGFANLPETIAVGAVTDGGVRASYSEPGANLVISAPSDGGGQGISTTTILLDETDTIVPGFTSQFGGTSAATPQISGVAALMIDANRLIGWRDIQEILMQTAVKVDPSNGDWYQNAAGLWFNHNYGAGLVDAAAAVQAAKDRTLPNLLRQRVAGQKEVIAPLKLNRLVTATIPNGTGDSYVMTFDLSGENNRRVEHVQLRTRILAERRGDLDVVLISPNGTQSILHRAHGNGNDQGINDWTFLTMRNWGEGSQGTWVLRVTDRRPGNAPATLNNAQLIIHGKEDASAPVVQAPLLVSDRVIFATQGVALTYELETLGADSVTVGALPAGLSFNAASGIISGTPSEAGVFETPLAIMGPSGTSNVTISLVIRPTAFSLGAAVEQDARDTTSGGDAPWDFEFANVDTDGDAVGSAENLGDNLESRFGFSNVAQSVITYSWSVSSEDGFDRLWFNQGGGSQIPHIWDAFIDGEKDWSQVSVLLPKASNTIEWIYSKDSTNAGGLDRGYVDNVKFESVETYQKNVEDYGNINFDFTLPSRTLWIPIADATATDGFSLKASGIGDGQAVTLAAWYDGPAELSFDYKVSSAPGDGIEYVLNGLLMNDAVGITGSGDVGWTTVTHTLPEGRNYIEIRFRKDFSGEASDDTAYLDNIQITPQNSIATWAGLHGVGDLDADPDADGYSNREEYAFGGNPLVSDIPRYAPTHVTTSNGRWIEFGIDTRNTDLNYEAQESFDLESWEETTFASFDRMEGYVQIHRIPICENPFYQQHFYRVMVTERP